MELQRRLRLEVAACGEPGVYDQVALFLGLGPGVFRIGWVAWGTGRESGRIRSVYLVGPERTVWRVRSGDVNRFVGLESTERPGTLQPVRLVGEGRTGRHLRHSETSLGWVGEVETPQVSLVLLGRGYDPES